MFHHRLLVYSDNQSSAATMQIRLVGPLKQHGFELVCAHQELEKNAGFGLNLAERFDALVVHRGIRKQCPHYSKLIATARAQQFPVIFDVDDLLFRVHREHPDFAVYQSRTAQALRVLLDADLVVASTPPLAQQISIFHPSVVVVPNELPASLWKTICRQRQFRVSGSGDQPVTIGYVGTETHRPDLESIEEALLSVLRRHRGSVRFLSVGVPLSSRLRNEPDVEQIKPGKRIVHDYSGFVNFVSTLPIDIGIAPLLDNPFNCCKSDLKFQEYAALGIAGVYGNLSTYRSSVIHGVNGMLATTPAEWESAIEQLVVSSDLREELAARSFCDLQNMWNAARSGGLWCDAITNASKIAKSRAIGVPHPMAPVLEEMIDYQNRLERCLKKSVRYQAGKLFTRLMRKWAA